LPAINKGTLDMTNARTMVLGLLLLAVSMAAPLHGQGEGLKASEIKQISKLLADVRAQPKYPTRRQQAKKDKVLKAFDTGIEKIRKAHKDADILTFVDSWREVFAAVDAAGRAKPPAGKGRVKAKEKSARKVRGREQGFEYALYVPSGYNPKSRWPLVIALHTEGATGADYLKEVWINKKRCPKETYDQFLFLAPTIGERTVGKDRKAQIRIEPFSRDHLKGVFWCMADVLARYNIDTDRIYLDGAGKGGEAAAWVGAMAPKWFAGISVRNARPATSGHFSKPELLNNLKGQAAMMVVDRKDGAFSDTAGQEDLKRIEHMKEVGKLPIEIKILDALPDDKSRRVAKGKQKVDPIHDATPEIAKFFAETRRDVCAPEVEYITYDNRLFKQTSWYIIDTATADPKDGSMASVKAKVDRETNVASFETHNVESFRIWLNDKLLDLDKPVKIVVNGKDVLEKKVERSLDFLLDYNRSNAHDPSLMAVGMLRVNVPAAPETDNGDGEGNGDKDD